MERLNKVIAQAGIASRRGADELIRNGQVFVNNKPARLGVLVNTHHDHIRVGKKTLSLKRKEYYLFHKPKGCLTTKIDPDGKPTIYDLLPPRLHHLFPVGRLDFNSSGLLILTNDGDLSHELSHPSFQVKKVYQVKVRGKPPEKVINLFKKGILLETCPRENGELKLGRASFNDIRKIKEVGKNSWFIVTVTEGRNLFIRRMFEKFGFGVVKLKRIQMGNFSLGKLKMGELRKITL